MKNIKALLYSRNFCHSGVAMFFIKIAQIFMRCFMATATANIYN